MHMVHRHVGKQNRRQTIHTHKFTGELVYRKLLFFGLFILPFFLLVLGMESRTLWVVGKCSTTESHAEGLGSVSYLNHGSE